MGDDVHDAGLRFTYRNGYSIHISLEFLRWYLEDDFKGFEGDPIPALALLVARDGFHSLGGKTVRGVSFEEWMAGDNYLCTARDVVRQRRLRQFTADLPFGIYSEQHGWAR